MELAVQVMMGVSLAACAGLRAWMPLLMVGLLARGGYLALNPAFEFLGRPDALVVFGVATFVEFLGDKIAAVDNVLDAAGTVVRPAAGTVLAASLLTRMDPLAASLLGLAVGGGVALTVHGGKAVLRAKSSALLPVHGGSGNAALSLAEDAATGAGVWTATQAPLIAFGFAVALVAAAGWLLLRALRAGRRGLARLRRGRAPG